MIFSIKLQSTFSVRPVSDCFLMSLYLSLDIIEYSLHFVLCNVQCKSRLYPTKKRNFMNILTIKQPFVDLILTSEKTLEIRTWQTKHRGRLYIQSSQSPKIDGKLSGYLLGFVDLIDIRKMRKSDEKSAHTRYIDNAYAWILKNPQRIRPIPLKGQLGIFGINLKEAVRRL